MRPRRRRPARRACGRARGRGGSAPVGAADLAVGDDLKDRLLVATLVAVFPANVWMAQHPERYRVPGGRAALIARLPLQAVFIAWVRSAARR